jgi:hypothetical protein
VLSFDTGVGGCEVSIGGGVAGIAVVLPDMDFIDEDLLVGNAPVEAQGRRNAEFGLGQTDIGTSA